MMMTMMMMIQRTKAAFLLSCVLFALLAAKGNSATAATASFIVATPTISSRLAAAAQGATKTATTAPKWSSSTRLYNILDDISDMIGMSSSSTQLMAQASLPHGKPFCQEKSCSNQLRTFAVQERLFSFTGEDFDIYDAFTGQPFLKVRGAMLHLPGKDKMRIQDATTNKDLLELDRKLIAATPTYDIYRGRGEQKIGWIEKKFISMTDTFDVYMQGQGGFGITGLLKPPPAYRITGDFLDRNFIMRNEQGQVVARVTEDWIIEFDQFNHYQVQIAPGMDAILVMACLCAIDEEFDEEHQKKKKQANK